MEGHRSRVVHGFAAVVCVVLCGTFTVAGGAARSVILLVAILGPALSILVRLLRGHLGMRRTWWLVLAGLGFLGANAVVWLVQVGLGDSPVATGPLADGTVLLGYACLLVGSVTLLLPFARSDRGGVLDAAIGGLGAASILWTLVAQPLDSQAAGTDGKRLYDLVVVLLVSAIAGMVGRTVLTSRQARGSLRYVAVAVFLTLLGNLGRVVTHAPDGTSAGWLGLVWIVAYTALGVAALHPASDRLTVPGDQTLDALSGRRLLFLGAALALNPTIAGILALRGTVIDWPLLCLSSLAVTPLVLARISQLARRQRDAEAALAHLASHDELTGLLNRRAALLYLDATLEQLEAGAFSAVTVVFLDVDGLKSVNDHYGHAAGDALLSGIADRLVLAIRSEDVVARLGGDEFVVVATGPTSCTADIVDRIREALERPVAWVETRPGTPDDHGVATAGREISLPAEASIGTVMATPGQYTTADDLLAIADARMYDEKRSRRFHRVVN